MAAQSNDIKQLFSHLGLNPGEYVEIRPKPDSNATVRRKPLPETVLQSLAQEPALPATEQVAAVVADRAVPAQPIAVSPVRVEASMPGEPAVTVTMNAPVAPAPNPASSDRLRSLFQQVKEPLTAGVPVEEEDANHEQPLQEAIAEAHYVHPTGRSRRQSAEDNSAAVALDAALARLKDAPPKLQTRPASLQTSTRTGIGSGGDTLQDVFRRLSKASKK